MKTDKMFYYRIGEHEYWLVPDFNVGSKQIYLTGCGMYNGDVEYLGYWDRFNMPYPLILKIQAFIKRAYALEIAERRLPFTLRKARKGSYRG